MISEPPRTLCDWIDRNAAARPHDTAFMAGDRLLTWQAYRDLSCAVAGLLVDCDLPRGAVVAVVLPDDIETHLVLAALERAGLVAAMLSTRFGERELAHLMALARPLALLVAGGEGTSPAAATFRRLRGSGFAPVIEVGDLLTARPILRVDGGAVELPAADNGEFAQRRLGPAELFLLNTTSGTTGMPKMVRHQQSRWLAWKTMVEEGVGSLQHDVFLRAVPAAVGFGLWSSHFAPAMAGAATAILPRFTVERLLETVQRRRVTLLSAVTTQLMMILASSDLPRWDLSSLRAVYTGGEPVPYDQARRFEAQTGAAVLQFYGSNEAGALSYTTLRDTQEKRLRTAGRPAPAVALRLLDMAGQDVTATGEGRPVCRGPYLGLGYQGDEAANRALYTEDGWMKLEDIVRIDAEGYLSVVGRVGDFIIRGGKNISAAGVEQAAMTHPAIALAGAVSMPDPIFGERVCLYAELRPNHHLDLPDLLAALAAAGISKEYFPERFIVLDRLPVGSGGKVAKAELRQDIRRRLGVEQEGAL